MSEAELHVLKARLRGGILNKVRRGEYRCPLPTGFVYDEAGQVVLDPDAQTRETIHHFFETFARVGSACQTVKVFRKEGLTFPSRLRLHDGTVFRPLTASAAMRVLHNPRYAGAYVYGRRRYRRTADGKKQIQRKRRRRRMARLLAQCASWLHQLGALPGAISRSSRPTGVDTKWRARRRRAREPPCCRAARSAAAAGRHFRVRYATRRGRQEAWYVCDRASGAHGEPNCQSIAGPPIDGAIGLLIARQMTPAAVELALDIRREIEARADEADQPPLSRDRARAARRRSGAAPIHAGRPEQPPGGRHARARLER